jgi:uracil DNA glycosylase
MTAFRNHSAEIMQHLKDIKRPVILTVNGKAAAVLQDADTGWSPGKSLRYLSVHWNMLSIDHEGFLDCKVFVNVSSVQQSHERKPFSDDDRRCDRHAAGGGSCGDA